MPEKGHGISQRKREVMKRVHKNACRQILGGCLHPYKSHMAGNFRGFYLTIEPRTGQYVVSVAASQPETGEDRGLKEFLRQQQEEKPQITGFCAGSHSIKFSVQIHGTARKVSETANSVLEPLIAYLAANHYRSGCESCGRPVSMEDQYEIDGAYAFLCSDCTLGLLGDGRLEKSNVFLGLAGAALGSLPGMALWLFFSWCGFIVGLAGAAIVKGASIGYQKLGNCLDKKGKVVSVLVTIAAIFLANRIGYAFHVYFELREYGHAFSEIFWELGWFLTPSGELYYYGGLFLGYLLTIAGMMRFGEAGAQAASSGQKIRKVKG